MNYKVSIINGCVLPHAIGCKVDTRLVSNKFLVKKGKSWFFNLPCGNMSRIFVHVAVLKWIITLHCIYFTLLLLRNNVTIVLSLCFIIWQVECFRFILTYTQFYLFLYYPLNIKQYIMTYYTVGVRWCQFGLFYFPPMQHINLINYLRLFIICDKKCYC